MLASPAGEATVKKSRDGARPGDVLRLMRIWQGTTPDGYALHIERDSQARWVVTVASVSRSRNESLETALLEAGGGSVPRAWAARLATAIQAQPSLTADIARTESVQPDRRLVR